MVKPAPMNTGRQPTGVFFSLMSFFRPKDPRKPVNGCCPRIKNIIIRHFRGIIGVLVPIFALTWQPKKNVHHLTVQCMWMLMFWFFLWQPVAIPVTGTIPIFLLPMTGVLSTPDTCSCYMNENIALFILSSMLILLLNNSGVDRRIALSLICSGDNCQFSGKRLVFKCSTAAFFLSMFSNRLIVTSTLIQYITPALMSLQASTADKRATEPDFNELRYIINNAIQTSSSIGSTAIMHSAYATICFRAIFAESAPEAMAYPDMFNFMQYSAFAFPVAFLMYIVNFAYHMILVNKCLDKAMSASSMTELRSLLIKHRNALPRRVSLHEKLTVFFTILSLVVFFFRWSAYLNQGWADYNVKIPPIPEVRDATVAAIFVVAMHVIPKGYGFLKFFNADTKSELPPLKPESAILFWRFVDKNVNYGYIFLIGSGVALERAVKNSLLDKEIVRNFGKVFTEHSFGTSMFMICLVAMIMANAMTGVAACCVFLPLVLSMAADPTPPPPPPPKKPDTPGRRADVNFTVATAAGEIVRRSLPDWPNRMYQGALGVGIACSLGFMFPFLYTPAYYCHYTGKVPMGKMAKYSLGSAILCLLILWPAVLYYAPVVYDMTGEGILPVPYDPPDPDKKKKPEKEAGTEGPDTGGDSGGGDSGGGDSGGGDSGGGET